MGFCYLTRDIFISCRAALIASAAAAGLLLIVLVTLVLFSMGGDGSGRKKQHDGPLPIDPVDDLRDLSGDAIITTATMLHTNAASGHRCDPPSYVSQCSLSAARNLLRNEHIETYGGPTVGRLAYVSLALDVN